MLGWDQEEGDTGPFPLLTSATFRTQNQKMQEAGIIFIIGNSGPALHHDATVG